MDPSVEGTAEMERHRTDDGSTAIQVKREVPFWGVLSVVGLVLVQAVLMYVEQREQSVTLKTIIITQTDINKQLVELSRELGNKNLKDIEHDLKISDLERRMSLFENRKRP